MYLEVAPPAGPTTMTTFMSDTAAAAGRAATPLAANVAAIVRLTASRRSLWPDALWAPSWATGNALASSLPEHRAWVTVTVVGAAAAECWDTANASAVAVKAERGVGGDRGRGEGAR